MCFRNNYILPSLLTIVALVNIVLVDVAIVSFFGPFFSSFSLFAIVGIVNILVVDVAIIVFFYLLLLFFVIGCSYERSGPGDCK